MKFIGGVFALFILVIAAGFVLKNFRGCGPGLGVTVTGGGDDEKDVKKRKGDDKKNKEPDKEKQQADRYYDIKVLKLGYSYNNKIYDCSNLIALLNKIDPKPVVRISYDSNSSATGTDKLKEELLKQNITCTDK